MAARPSSAPRKRNLVILAAVTLACAGLAGLAVFDQSRELTPAFQPHPFFPGLEANVNGVNEIAVTAKSGTFHIRLVGGKWVVAEKDSFPADAAAVRAAAAGMASLEAVDPKTDKPELLGILGLDAPAKGGDGVEIALTGGGKILADLLVGHTEGTADDLGRTLVYVRKPNENQAWLARGYLQPKATIGDWLDKNVISIGQDQIKGATVTPDMGPTYELARDTKDQPDFKLLDLPKGRELSFDGSPDGVAGAIAGFSFDDVAKAGTVDFSKAAQSVTHMFDGLDVTVKVAAKDMDHWATIMAAGTTEKTMAEAAAINAKTAGWAFKLPAFEATKFAATRESLLKPAETAKQAAAAAKSPKPAH